MIAAYAQASFNQSASIRQFQKLAVNGFFLSLWYLKDIDIHIKQNSGHTLWKCLRKLCM